MISRLQIKLHDIFTLKRKHADEVLVCVCVCALKHVAGDNFFSLHLLRRLQGTTN